jgi:excisionase family DNA binding protein
MYLTKKEVAELLKVSEKTIERWIKNNNMPHSRVGNTLRFDQEEVESWFKSQK